MLSPQTLGHQVLRAREIARSEAFYAEVLGLRVKPQPTYRRARRRL